MQSFDKLLSFLRLSISVGKEGVLPKEFLRVSLFKFLTFRMVIEGKDRKDTARETWDRCVCVIRSKQTQPMKERLRVGSAWVSIFRELQVSSTCKIKG